MRNSNKILPTLVSAAIALIAVTNYCILYLVARPGESGAELFAAVWPIALPTSVAVVLLMSTLYHAFQKVVARLEERQDELLATVEQDALTGAASRKVLEDRLGQAILHHRRSKDKFALVMLDLDHFKRVNDVHGHQVGDELLRQTAARLRSVIRESDTVARFGGDEFLILQHKLSSRRDVDRLCARICEAMRPPFNLDGCELRTLVSVGAVIADTAFNSVSDYIRAADVALYDAKAGGRNCHRFFSSKLDAQLRRRDKLESGLRTALSTGEGLDVCFQPQISASGCVIGAETLFRWRHPELGQVPAAEAVAIAEDSELIEGIAQYTFRRAAEFARRNPDLFVAVNLSPAQFSRAGSVADTFKLWARQEAVEPYRFELEVTEKLFLGQENGCELEIEKLRKLGFRIALDDFGTGYSSLSYLRRFKVDRLKLDKSFADTGDIAADIAIVRAAVTLAQVLGLEVVAEGIETQMQEAIALEGGCNALQGFRYAGALEADSRYSKIASAA